jgi:hypothetical protein
MMLGAPSSETTRVQSDGWYEVYWPRAQRQQKRRALAPRLSSLEGKTVAQLWDFLFRGDELFATLEEALRARYPGIRFISWREFGNTHGRDEREVVAPLPERLRAFGVDAVISGMAC